MAKRKKKSRRKNTLSIIISIIIVLLAAICFYLYNTNSNFKELVDHYISNNTQENNDTEDNTQNSKETENNTQENNQNENTQDNNDSSSYAIVNTSLVTENLSIHFIAPSSSSAGDSIYIKANGYDILVDAGPLQSSSADIASYINNYVTDGKLEYVISTHSDKDHISGFVGTVKSPGIFERYQCGTIIDFALCGKDTSKSTSLISQYYTKLNEAVENGATHYTALECYNNENGAQRTYDLGNNISINILYNYYYDHQSSDENNYSVCFLLKENNHNYLFTGDLEKSGEEYLVQYNELPEVDLFKAGHHGSPTSSNDCLLSVIKPKICVVCCCAGTDEYTKEVNNQFPSQAFISRICKYTDKVYVLNQVDETTGYKPMNGTVIVAANPGEDIKVYCTNDTTLLKDTEWFKEYRKWE